jgi:hypothetical protein
VAGLESLLAAPDWVGCEAMIVKLKLQRRLQKSEMPGVMKFAKENCRQQTEPAQERGHVGCKQQGHKAGMPQC